MDRVASSGRMAVPVDSKVTVDRSWRARMWERVGCGYDDLILMGDAVSDAKALAV